MAITRPPPQEAPTGYAHVFAHLRDQLLSGAIRPGDRLMPERDLATHLGVSRPSLREALRALAVLGVVETRHGAGTTIRRPDPAILGDFFALATAHHPGLTPGFTDDIVQARIAIECQAIRLAATRATPSDIDRLGAALLHIAATIDDPAQGGTADHAFHTAIVHAAHSETLATLYAALTPLLIHSHTHRRHSIASLEDGRTYLIDHHRLVFDAILAADPRGADDLLREHFAIGDGIRRRLAATPRQEPVP